MGRAEKRILCAKKINNDILIMRKEYYGSAKGLRQAGGYHTFIDPPQLMTNPSVTYENTEKSLLQYLQVMGSEEND